MGCGFPVVCIDLEVRQGGTFHHGIATGTLTFTEFAVKGPLPLATIQEAVLEFLQGRNDVVAYDAQAVDEYVDEPRMTQGVDSVDILSHVCSSVCQRASRVPAGSIPGIRARKNRQGRSGYSALPGAQAPGIATWTMSDSSSSCLRRNAWYQSP